ncbi:MAG: hypothetical protein GX902_02425 [Lentisphaerae bacterium]|nr:hypothetical protein [Lentisphaerota bacterium]
MTIYSFYQQLFDWYGPQHWWPCRSGQPWEIICGAILTQNCAWTNVEKALDNLHQQQFCCPQAVLAADYDSLEAAIRPAGFFRQKRAYLQSAAEFFLTHTEEYQYSADLSGLRQKLLALKGIGPETADSILLYAFQRPVFVIDAYTRRVASRHLGLPDGLGYDRLQAIFQDALPLDVQLYNEYHALIVRFCKESCRKNHCGARCPPPGAAIIPTR